MYKNGDFKSDPSESLSVRGDVLLSSIPIKQTGRAKLHRFLGEGNNTVGPEGVLVKRIEDKIVQYSEKEKEVRLELSNIDGVTTAAQVEKANWICNTNPEGSQPPNQSASPERY